MFIKKRLVSGSKSMDLNYLHTLKRLLLKQYVRYVLINDLCVTGQKYYTLLQKNAILGIYNKLFCCLEYEIFSDVAQGYGYTFPISYSDRLVKKMRR